MEFPVFFFKKKKIYVNRSTKKEENFSVTSGRVLGLPMKKKINRALWEKSQNNKLEPKLWASNLACKKTFFAWLYLLSM